MNNMSKINSNNNTNNTCLEIVPHKEPSNITSTAMPYFDFYEREKALHAIKSSNIYPSECVKLEELQMATLAHKIYSNPKDISAIEHLFPHGLIVLPSPEEMGIEFPPGLCAGAFRHGNEVIIAIRGTEITQDLSTGLANIIADAGIGHHKSNEDLLDSVKHVKSRLQSLYGYKLDDTIHSVFESLVNERITGDTDSERRQNFNKEVAYSAGKGGLIGGTVGTIFAGITGACLVGLGAMALPVLGTVGTAVALSSAALGAGFNATKTSLSKGFTLADGYPRLLSYVKALDQYITKLKETKIRDTDTLITTGHSLAGYLSGLVGAFHADTAFAFNGPGVLHEKDVKHTLHNLGLKRNIHSHFDYRSISMEGDFIGNLGKRSGTKRTLYLPFEFKSAHNNLPECVYTDLLSHHGIHLMVPMLQNSTVHSLPKHLPILLLEGPKKDAEEKNPKETI